MTVEELIKYLQKQEPWHKVGFFDHFGEFHPLREAQISQRAITVKNTKKRVGVIVIEPPDFGPEPD